MVGRGIRQGMYGGRRQPRRTMGHKMGTGKREQQVRSMGRQQQHTCIKKKVIEQEGVGKCGEGGGRHKSQAGNV